MKKEILIKGMVCGRCIAVLHKKLESTGYHVEEVSLGKVVFGAVLCKQQQQSFQTLLRELGFDLVVDKQASLVSQMKEIIQSAIDQAMEGRGEKFKLSQLLAVRLGVNYSSLSELFSRFEGMTIEQFVIQRRLQLVTELLEHTDKNFTDIAELTGFSSVFHFSRQFKELTGYTPSQYRESKKLGALLKYPLKTRASKSQKVKSSQQEV